MPFTEHLSKLRRSKRLRADNRNQSVASVNGATTTAGLARHSRNLSTSSLLRFRQRIDSVVAQPAMPPYDENNQDDSSGSSSSKDTPQPKVVESPIRLLPACYHAHGVYRHRDKDPCPTELPPRLQHLCGTHEACHTGMIVPAAAAAQQPGPANPEEDLTCWILTPLGDSLDDNDDDDAGGVVEIRDAAFVTDVRYTRDMLLAGFVLAVEHVRYEVSHLRSLVEYAARPPYCRSVCWEEHDELRSLRVKVASLKSAARGVVERALVVAVRDLDVVRARVGEMREYVLRCKMQAAKGGDVAELADLLRIGVVDGEWVEKECGWA